MAVTDFDVAILGGGMGGYPAAIRASQLGLKTAVIEEDKVGGTCLHRGCIPTKALLQSAALLDQLQHAAAFGVNTEGVSFDYAVAGKRRDQVVNQLYRGVEFLLKKNKVSVVRGRGRLAGAGRVAVAAPPTTSLPERDYLQRRALAACSAAVRRTVPPA